MTRYLGIDIGTTFLKGAVLDLAAGAIAHLVRLPVPAPVAGLPSTRYELDSNAVLAAVRGLLGDLLRAAPDARGLVMCSQMHCLVFTDAHGRPHSNVITWKDQRALEPSPSGHGMLFEDLAALVTAEEQRQLGGEMRVGVPIATLFALRRQGLLPQGLYAVSLPDFVMANLCGLEPTTDPTLASAQGLFHIDRSDWHRELIEKLGFGALHWPRIRPSGEVLGEASIDGRAITCHVPIGDQQCALLGAELREGELSLNISTGSQASLLSRTVPRGDFQVRPYLDGMWLKTIVSVPAGRSLVLLVDLLTEIGRGNGSTNTDPWEYIRSAVEGVESSDLEVDLSFFASLTARGGGSPILAKGI